MLTASGGPFRGRTRDELEDVTPEEALAHPTWSMGPKITVDSATLANKGLELIEAHFLFGLPYDRIEVVVQPTSVVHALVRFRDGASLAHLGYPDMRVPISFALTYPERAATPVPPLDFSQGLVLEFEPPDLETFPLLALARRAGEDGGTYPCAFNAANEVAVAAFLEGRLPFLGDRRDRRGDAGRGRRRARARPRRAGRGRRGARAGSRSEGSRSREHPRRHPRPRAAVLIHEAGHFFTARAVGMRPRKFYIGFPPAVVKWTRNGIEYGIGAIPLGGYVKIPGMHRPAPSDLDVHFGPALYEEPRLLDATSSASSGSSPQSDFDERARGARRRSSRRSQSAKLSPKARRAADRGLSELGDALGAGRLLARSGPGSGSP